MSSSATTSDGLGHVRGIKIGDFAIGPGQRRSLDLPVAQLPTGSWLSVPMEVICGVRSGPRVWLTATIHGDELNGLEIIHRVLKQLDVKNFGGVLVVAPVMNILGFMNQTRTLPDGSDLNRSFPGSRNGSLAERLGRFFTDEVVSKCSYGIDLHSGANNRLNPPQIRADLADAVTRRLAAAFAAPITMDAAQTEGSLRTAAVSSGNRVLLFEGGEPLRYNEDSLRSGTEGVLRVLHALQMHDGEPRPPDSPSIELSADDEWVKAPRCGILRLNVTVMDEVHKGEKLGVVADVLGAKAQDVVAPFDGFVIGISLNPLVAKDGGVLHLAKRVK